ncbi:MULTISPECIES: hypothetical protein [Bacillus cereus group]|nr:MULTISPECIES: hypothetical protein [Bacillus cereus group]
MGEKKVAENRNSIDLSSISWVVGYLIASESHPKAGVEEIFMLAY